jgi:iron complex transport system substrate-binding protein
MRAAAPLLLPGLFGLLAGGAAAEAAPAVAADVVSLDYCADQYVLELLPKDRILALSPDAEEDFSYYRDRAAGMTRVRPVAEDVIVLGPRLVVRSYGGGHRALEFFARAGIAVLQVPYADELGAVRQALLDVARGLGVPERGTALALEMDARLAVIEKPGAAQSALYLTAGGATTGPGTLVHELLEAAGLENFETRAGWHSVPLERLAREQPEVVVSGFFDSSADRTAYWSAMRHPVARRLLYERPAVMLPGALTSCGGWFVLDAIEALAAAQ